MYILSQKGFIIISSNKLITPILGYSFEHNFNIDQLPRQLEKILQSFRNNIQYAVAENLSSELINW